MNKILIVEDQDTEAEVLRNILNEHDIQAAVANDALQATMMALNEKPDLILLDLQMPAGSGLSAMRNIKRSTKTKYTPIIVLTGSNDLSMKKQMLDSGADGYLQKPYDPKELIAIIKGYL